MLIITIVITLFVGFLIGYNTTDKSIYYLLYKTFTDRQLVLTYDSKDNLWMICLKNDLIFHTDSNLLNLLKYINKNE